MAADVSSILRDLNKQDGVSAAIVASRDGFVIDSATSDRVDVEGLGALIAMAIGGSETLGAEFELGSLDQYMVEFQHGKVLISTVGDNILGIVTDASAVIGSIRYTVKKQIPALERAL